MDARKRLKLAVAGEKKVLTGLCGQAFSQERIKYILTLIIISYHLLLFEAFTIDITKGIIALE